MPRYTIRLLEKPEEMNAVVELQRIVWPGSETDVIPAHVLITAAHNGGLILGAYEEDILMGYVFGFPGIEMMPDGAQLKHCSHQLAVRPDARDAGLGFTLKRAQWQMLRQQGLSHATWTYDPLLSRNANLNIAKLGATCNTYLRSYYGEMRDGLNYGLPTDRFQVDWWLISRRVERRLGKQPRGALPLKHVIQAGSQPLYALQIRQDGLPSPPEQVPIFSENILTVEIPPDFMALKTVDMQLARTWRDYTREVFEVAFSSGYIVTDFIFERNQSYYVLSHGEATLESGL